jgi:hypothetical protein
MDERDKEPIKPIRSFGLYIKSSAQTKGVATTPAQIINCNLNKKKPASFFVYYHCFAPTSFLTCYSGEREPLSDYSYLYEKQEHHGMHVPFGSVHSPVPALYMYVT